MKLNRTPSLYDRQWRNEENENWNDIEKALSFVADFDDAVDNVIDLVEAIRDSRLSVYSPSFENGTIGSGGQNTSSTIRARTQEVIYLKPGDRIVTAASNEDLEYSLMLYDDYGDFISGWGLGYYDFGTDYAVTENIGMRVVALKKDSSGVHQEITDADLREIESLFSIVSINDESGRINTDDVLNVLESVGLLSYSEQKLNFEKGTVSSEGVQLISDIRIRTSEIIEVNKGDVVQTSASADGYKYSLMYYKNGVFDTGWGIGYVDFGENHTIEEKTGVIPIILKAGSSGVHQEITDVDLENVSELFKIISSSGSSTSSDEVDHFNIIGKVESFTNEPLTDFYADPNAVTPQGYHDDLIALANDNSDIAEYELLGQDAYDYNMYSYRTIPNIAKKSPAWNTTPDENTGTQLKIPKIIITSGIHGSERNTNYVVHHFLKKLLGGENEVYDTLLNNIEFVVVPMCNPSGFVDNTYNNRTNMNLNRNFPPYGSASQPESALIKAVIDAHSDADYHLDVHNFTPQSGKYDIIGYALTDDDALARITTNTYKYLGFQWQKRNSAFPQERNHQWGYTSGANVGTVGRYSHEVHGIPSSIIETSKSHLFIDEENHGVEQTQIGVDLLANTIVGILESRR